jgi:hypothetical protein
MDLGPLPEGWVSWEVEPIEPGSKRTLDERLVGRGKLTRQLISNRALDLDAGASMRRRLLTSGIRGGYGLVNRLELDPVLRMYAEDCEYIYDDGAPLGIAGKAHGRDEVRALFNQFDEVFEQRFYFPRLVVDPGGSRFGGVVDSRAIAHASRIEVSVRLWHAVEMRDGLIRRHLISSEREAALTRMSAA